MLFSCAFIWFPGTTREEVARRVVSQHDAGANHPERIRGWYNLAGGGAGFLLVEYDDPKELTAFLQPYMAPDELRRAGHHPERVPIQHRGAADGRGWRRLRPEEGRPWQP